MHVDVVPFVEHQTVVPFLSDNDEDVQVHSNDDAILVTGEIINITWSPSDLTEDLLLEEDTTVDISMVH